MGSNKKLGIFWFRKDFRIHDNYALLELNNKVDNVLPIFIIDPIQAIQNKYNKLYYSNNAVQFMFKSLSDLYDQTHEKLLYFYGNPHIILTKIIKELINRNLDLTLAFNADFTRYSLERDNSIIELCKQLNITTIVNYEDQTLIPFKKLIKLDNKPYIRFIDFFNNAIKTRVKIPIKLLDYKFIKLRFKSVSIFEKDKIRSLYKYNNNLIYSGGRNNCIVKLSKKNRFKNFDKERQQINNYTTEISAYINFGCMSIREIYHHNKQYHDFVRQLYWKDYHLCIFRLITNKNIFLNTFYNKIKWKNSKKDWELLLNAKTGFLLIDAAITELRTIGYINNRLRMLLCIFSIKYLLINPFHEYGIQNWFSKYLVDCNSSQNIGNIRWLIELDLFIYNDKHHKLSGRPYTINNEIIKKYDPNCEYIKKWLEHLKDIDNEDIFNWGDNKKYNKLHPMPMFDDKEKYQIWLNLTKN
jgi:deoxyribodipyrimidine photo-lyase